MYIGLGENTHDPKIPNLAFEAVNFPIVVLGEPFEKG